MSAAVVLTLPYPISANRYWATRVVKSKHTGKPMAMTYVTPEAEAYRKAVAGIASGIGLSEPFPHRVAVTLDLYPHRPQDWARRARKEPQTWDDTVQCIDLGNAEKVLSDALQGIVFTDDKWIWDLHKRRKEPDGEGRVVVTITPIAVAHMQPSLLGDIEAVTAAIDALPVPTAGRTVWDGEQLVGAGA
jgi:crossover junction endodeoxyribonuclease RusA